MGWVVAGLPMAEKEDMTIMDAETPGERRKTGRET